MVNSYFWGQLAENADLKQEFVQECATLDRGPTD
jgi:hypothetical protein